MSYDNADTMSAFFSGKLKDDINTPKEPDVVELGHGIGIGHKNGTYDQYMKQLREQNTKGNGTIHIGKVVKIGENTVSIQDHTDKFLTEDVPKLLIMFNTILNNIRIKAVWKDQDNNQILEQYYEIPSAHSNNYDWWDLYSVWFIGPENLDEGYYNIEIMSKEFGREDNVKALSTSIEFSVIS